MDLKVSFPEDQRPSQLRVTSFTPIEVDGQVYSCEHVGPYRAEGARQDVDPALFEDLKARFPNAEQQLLSAPLTADLQLRRGAVGATMIYVEAIQDGVPYLRGCACVRDKSADQAKLPAQAEGGALAAACPKLMKRGQDPLPLSLELGPILPGEPKLRWLRPPARTEAPSPVVAVLHLELDGRVIYPDRAGVFIAWNHGAPRLLSSSRGLVFGDSPQADCTDPIHVTFSLPNRRAPGAVLEEDIPCVSAPRDMTAPEMFTGTPVVSYTINVAATEKNLYWPGLPFSADPWVKAPKLDTPMAPPMTTTWADGKLLISSQTAWTWGTQKGHWSQPWKGTQLSCSHEGGAVVANEKNLVFFDPSTGTAATPIPHGRGALAGIASGGDTLLLATTKELSSYRPHASGGDFSSLPSSSGNRGLAAAGTQVFLHGLSPRTPSRPGDPTPATIWQMDTRHTTTLSDAVELIWVEPGRQFSAVSLATWSDGELVALYEDLNPEASDRLRLLRWRSQDGRWRPQLVPLPPALQPFTRHRLLTTDSWLFLASSHTDATMALRWAR